MEKHPLVPKGITLPFILLTSLFFAWAIPNNLTDTMLAAFKRIMSLTDTKTAWIQVSCYLLGYGCFAIPGALFIKRYTYRSGVMLGLGLYALGAFLFFPAMLTSEGSISLSFSLKLNHIIGSTFQTSCCFCPLHNLSKKLRALFKKAHCNAYALPSCLPAQIINTVEQVLIAMFHQRLNKIRGLL